MPIHPFFFLLIKACDDTATISLEYAFYEDV
jgi:hypothetical protein